VELDFPGTATDAVDYTAAIEAAIAAATGSGISYNSSTNVLTFTAGGATSLSFTLTAVNDDLLDSGETIQVHLATQRSSEGNVGITDAPGHRTISDLDQSLNFSVSVDDEGAESAGNGRWHQRREHRRRTPRPSR
jgi:hypothetical protein